MDRDIRLAAFTAIQILLLVTPLVFPTIPTNLAVALYALAGVLALYALVAAAVDLRLRHREGTHFGWPFISLKKSHEKPIELAPPPQPSRPVLAPIFSPRSVIIVDMAMDWSRVGHAAPWLDFVCFGFNGSHHGIKLLSASGRIKVRGIEFHDSVKLAGSNNESPPAEGISADAHRFFLFRLNLSLNDRAARFIQEIANEAAPIAFIDAKLTIAGPDNILESRRLANYDVQLPQTIAFDFARAQPQPTFVQQVISR